MSRRLSTSSRILRNRREYLTLRDGVLLGTNASSALTYGSISRFDLTRKNATVKTIFTFPTLSSGAGRQSSLLFDSSGTIYGTTSEGGTGLAPECLGYGCGTIFKLTPSANGYKETVLYDFKGTNDVAFPNAPIFDSSGTMFVSMGSSGGSQCAHRGCGTIASFKPATRMSAAGNSLFGVTRWGGTDYGAGDGTVFQVSI
jgi:hypothetical protein